MFCGPAVLSKTLHQKSNQFSKSKGTRFFFGKGIFRLPFDFEHRVLMDVFSQRTSRARYHVNYLVLSCLDYWYVQVELEACFSRRIVLNCKIAIITYIVGNTPCVRGSIVMFLDEDSECLPF